MSKKQKRDSRAPLPIRTGTSNPPQAAGDRGAEVQGALLASQALHARELIAGRHSKAAVEVAKELHKRYATPESESLLFFVSWMLLPQEPVEDRSSQPTDAKETVLVCIAFAVSY